MTTPQLPLASIPRRVIARIVDLMVEFVPAIVAVAAIPNSAIRLHVYQATPWVEQARRGQRVMRASPKLRGSRGDG